MEPGIFFFDLGLGFLFKFSDFSVQGGIFDDGMQVGLGFGPGQGFSEEVLDTLVAQAFDILGGVCAQQPDDRGGLSRHQVELATDILVWRVIFDQ